MKVYTRKEVKAACRFWLAREQEVRDGSQDSYMPRDINYPLKILRTTWRTFYKVWWSAKQSSGTRPIMARHFTTQAHQIMFLRGNDIYLPRDLQRRHTKLTDIL